MLTAQELLDALKNKSVEEVARDQNVSKVAIYHRVHRAMESPKKRIRQGDGFRVYQLLLDADFDYAKVAKEEGLSREQLSSFKRYYEKKGAKVVRSSHSPSVKRVFVFAEEVHRLSSELRNQANLLDEMAKLHQVLEDYLQTRTINSNLESRIDVLKEELRRMQNIVFALRNPITHSEKSLND